MPQRRDSQRWKDRRVLAALLGFAIAVVPIAGAVGAAIGVRAAVASPDTVVGFGLWWLGILAASTVAFVGLERLARRALPLAVLLKMGMAFPGRAPRRLAVARRAASVRDLHKRIEEARSRGVADEPTVAADKIVTLAAMLNAHDRTTRGHAERVRALTDMIADELHLPAIHRDRLRWSSLLHDIGKLTVHPDVLNKSGVLSAGEWELLRRHPLEGARLTAPIASWLGEWANTIAEHHERFDGRGYPYGRSGRQISLGGRIVAVADSYDVMTSVRSYKRPTTPEKARQELAACAGTQFDPDVVRAFLAVSIWRLRLAAPLSWVGSMTPVKALGSVARVGAVSGHAVASGAMAAVAILGVGLHAASSPPSSTTQADAAVASGSSASPAATPTSGLSVGSGADAKSHSSTGPAGDKNGSTAGSTETGGGSTTTTSSTHSGVGTATTTTTTHVGATTTTTHPGTTTTTASSSTTTTVPPSTTTTTVAPAAPTGLTAAGQCRVFFLVPEVVLSWTPSTSASVTSQTVLRANAGSDSFDAIASLSAGASSYTDTTVSGFGSSYTYEIQADGPGGSSTSSPATATTPPYCL